MKKLVLTGFIVLGILAGCQKGDGNKADDTRLEEKTVEKDKSALRYRMFKVEGATVEQVAQLFKSYLEEEGMYYPRFVDFHSAAQIDNIEFDMNPTVLVIFGHPKEMGLLIRENPEVAYDLPFRILIYQNDEGEVWVMHKDFESFKKQYFLADQHNLLPKYNQLVEGFKKKLPSYINRFQNQNP